MKRIGSNSRLRNLLPGTLTYVAVAALAVQPSAHAELSTYESRVDFEAAVTSQTLFTEGFDGFVTDQNLRDEPADLLDGAVRISATASFDTERMRIDAPPYNGTFDSGGVDSLTMQDTFVFATINSDTSGTITLEFVPREGCHHAVGFDYSGAAGYIPAGVKGVTSYRVTTQDGSVTTVPFTVDDGFLGFFDPDSPIASVTLLDTSTPSGDPGPAPGEGLGFDNLTVSLADSDADGMHDFFEDSYGLDKEIDDTTGDPDGDLVSNREEFGRHTDPQNPDTDGDGLMDGIESDGGSDATGTSPLMADSDGDGLSDSQEIPNRSGWDSVYRGTDPNLADTDGDGVLDGFEISQRSLPTALASQPGGLASGLVSHWDFDGHVRDLVGGNHGSAYDTRIPFVEGKFGQAGDFEVLRTSVRVTAGDESAFDFLGGSMSVSLWFRIDGFNTDWQWQTLIAKGNDSNGGWRLRRRGSSNRLTFATAAGDVDDAGPEVADGQWHHVLVVAEAGISTRLYVDGALAANGPAPVFANTNLRLAMAVEPRGSGFGRRSQGCIDDVAIWGRILSEDEIAAIWNDGSGASIGDLLSAPFPLGFESFGFQPATGRAQLTWISRPRKSYALDRSTDLQEWEEILDSITSQGVMTQLTDDDVPVPLPQQLFYRLRPEN